MENNSTEQGINEIGSADTWKIYREAAELEYEYAHIDSNKLDNKVYILLAVCAFLFPILYSVRFETADFMSSWPAVILTIIKFMPLICLSIAIIMLTSVLKTVQIPRVDVFNLIQENNNESFLDTERKFALLYAISRHMGIEGQIRKCKIADTALIFIIASVILFMTAVIQRETLKGGELSMQMNQRTVISQEEAAKMTFDELINYTAKTGNPMPRIPTASDVKKSKYVFFLGESRDI